MMVYNNERRLNIIMVRSKKDEIRYFWVAEQYYHSDEIGGSWGKPLRVCEDEKQAKDLIELEAKLYASDFSDYICDREVENMITIRPNNSLRPSMDFWYYKVQLINPEADLKY